MLEWRRNRTICRHCVVITGPQPRGTGGTIISVGQVTETGATRRVIEFVAPASWPAVAWVSRPTQDTVCSTTGCANGIVERGCALAARTPPVQPTRRSALQSIDQAASNAGKFSASLLRYGSTSPRRWLHLARRRRRHRPAKPPSTAPSMPRRKPRTPRLFRPSLRKKVEVVVGELTSRLPKERYTLRARTGEKTRIL